MANYKEKSEMELQDMLVELKESNETLETLLPDDDIQAEIDANNKNIADINATIKGGNSRGRSRRKHAFTSNKHSSS